jgi:hypothetical protein
MVDFDVMTPLGDLCWHWGTAYVLSGIIGHWRAERRDDGRVLTADDPEKLRQAIIRDYTRKPVPRTPSAAGMAGVEAQGSTF